jgi:hypothetical protein
MTNKKKHTHTIKSHPPAHPGSSGSCALESSCCCGIWKSDAHPVQYRAYEYPFSPKFFRNNIQILLLIVLPDPPGPDTLYHPFTGEKLLTSQNNETNFSFTCLCLRVLISRTCKRDHFVSCTRTSADMNSSPCLNALARSPESKK